MNADAVVPNHPPSIDPGAIRLAVVAEAPAVEECSWRICSQGHGYGGEHWENRQIVTRDRCPACGSTQWTERPTPLVGQSGRLLNDLLKDAGLPRERVWVGNVSRRPLAEAEKTLDQNRGGLARLAYDLSQFKPNCVLALGGLALKAFLGDHRFGDSITNWRGSVFEGVLDGVTYKVVGAMHPAAILREPSQLALLRFDVARSVAEAASSTLDTPRRVVDAPNDAYAVVEALQRIRARREPVGFDIEGGCETGVTVLSFADTPLHALSVPFRRMDWSRVWGDQGEDTIWYAVRLLCEDEAVPKVMHNAGYETFALRWLHGIRIQGVEDSMLAFHAVWPELDKALDVVASLLTRQPYWGTTKDWRTDEDRDTYNAIDSCVCLEAFQAIQRLEEWTPAVAAYYRHCRDLLEPCGEMSFAGIPYDAAARDTLVAKLKAEVYALTGELDTLAGIAPPTFAEVAEAVCMKIRLPKVGDWADILTYARPTMRETL